MHLSVLNEELTVFGATPAIAMAESWRSSQSQLSSGDVPVLPSVNVELANRGIAEKCYKVMLKGSAKVQSVRFQKHQSETIFSRLCEKFGLQGEDTVIKNPLRQRDANDAEEVTIINRPGARSGMRGGCSAQSCRLKLGLTLNLPMAIKFDAKK